MQIAILGPLEVRDAAGAAIPVAGARVRTLFARLALEAGSAVSLSALVDAVWGAQPPTDETNALQTLVSRLRRALHDPGVISQSAAGYRLSVDRAAVDAHRFERLAADGSRALHDGAPDEAAGTLAEALGLWRGPALADVLASSDTLAAAATRLEDLRITALVDRIEADLRRSAQPGPLVSELETLVADRPLHEGLAGQLIRALATSGRQADALQAYERIRGELADELGVDPGAALRDVHLAVLRGELAAPKPIVRRTNLKAQLTSFVGREAEVTRIGKSLEQNRLVTLVGPGGAGKTRLAAEAAARVLDTAPDGIWLVELAPVTAGADVPQAVLVALGMREMHLLDRRTKMSASDATSRLLDGLADKCSVLVLDNCEHLIEACARLADQLLAESPGLRILATSREPLGILGEALLAVPPLGQPNTSASAHEAVEYPAVRLFADRAAAVLPDFEIDDDDVATVIDIVRRLDGLPLAIELAAARLRSMPLNDIAARLDDRFRLLTGGSRTALPRHRTLRAVVEWSWELLGADERHVVEQLAVFPSGVTPASAANVCRLEAPDMADVLASLVDKSLLQLVDGGRRLRMLETIREYGIERLAERGELAGVRERHAVYFADVLAEAEPHLTRADQLPWFDLLMTERDNIVSALRYRCDTGDANGALQIATDLGAFAMMLGTHEEITAWISEALSVDGPADPNLRMLARALVALNVTANGDVGNDYGPQALRELANEMSDVPQSTNPVLALLRPAVAFFAEDRELTARYLDDALANKDPWARAAAHMLCATLAENDGDTAVMRCESEIAVAEFEVIGERWGLANALRVLGQVRMLDGDLDSSAQAYERALELSATLKSHDDEGFLLGRLAELEIRRGNLAEARSYINLARRRSEESGSAMESVFTLAMLAAVEFAAGEVQRARDYTQQAEQRLSSMPMQNPARGHLRAMVSAMSARSHIEDGDVARAGEVIAESYEAAVATKDLPILANVGLGIARYLAATGDLRRAVVTLGAAARLRGSDDLTSPEVRELTDELRDTLGAADFDDAYAEGAALEREPAIRQLDPA